jgi:acetolactate synthase I/II/III large subunit
MISLLKSSIEFVVCRHEQSAAFMAGMHGHLTGKPGVCLATLGPGATNLITGVANSNMDHAPIVAIIGQASTHRLHKESHQNMDAISMYKPVCKWATSIRDADVIPEVIAKAFKIAISSKPGATVIELPEDIAKLPVKLKPLVPSIEAIPEERADPKQVERALDLLANSQSTVLLAGAGCVRERCDDSLKEFLDKTGIYGANTFMGKGAISARNPQSLYCVGLGMKDIAIQAFDQADLVICAGYDLVEWPADHWNEGHRKKIIHIDTLPAEVDKDYLPDVELIGNIKGALQLLNSKLTEAHKKDPNKFANIRQKITEELEEYNADEGFPVKPQRILSDLRSVMRDDDILISDVGAHKMWVARQYPTYQSNTCFISNGFCSMAGSIPGAFAAKRLHPEKNVVALCGDGGFIMGIQAVPTAVRYKTAITLLVWEDDCYGLIKWKQEAAYHEHSHINLDNPDLAQVAESFGCLAIRITKADELKSALQAAFQETERPTVIVVPVDYNENMKLTKRLGKILPR